MVNIPNIITFLRIAIIPVFVVVYLSSYEEAHTIAAGLFFIGAVTDWLDGYLARKLNQYSSFGAFLDPVADKLLIVSALVLLVSDEKVHMLVINKTIFSVVVLIIISREISISALREWMAEVGKRANINVSYIGKVKTTVQMIAVIMLIYREPLVGFPIILLGELLLYIASGLTLWSMFLYLKIAWPDLVNQK